MSIQSQENHMRQLAALLRRDLGYLAGPQESGPNGDKRTFLHVGNVFLRALARDLGLQDVQVKTNPGGIAVSGECTLVGMWEHGGMYLSLGQSFGRDSAILYRPIRSIRDHKGGYNRFLTCADLKRSSYKELLDCLLALKKGGISYGRAA